MQHHVTWPDGKVTRVNPGPQYPEYVKVDPRDTVIVPLYPPSHPDRLQTVEEIQELLDGEFGVLTFTSDQRNPYYWIATPADTRALFRMVGAFPTDWLPWGTEDVILAVNGEELGMYKSHPTRQLVRTA